MLTTGVKGGHGPRSRLDEVLEIGMQYRREHRGSPRNDEAYIDTSFNLWNKPSVPFFTGVYVMAVDPFGTVHFGFGRKIPPGRRVPYGWMTANRSQHPQNAPQSVLVGAAGTKDIYWGKWASLGGGADPKSKYILDAARIEVNDEADIRPKIFPKQIFVPGANRPPAPDHRITLIHSDQPTQQNVFITVFKWENWYEFVRLFPNVEDQTVRGGFEMAKASHGEIDYTASFTVQQIFNFNERALNTGVNFFTSYTLASFKNVVAPGVLGHVKFLARTQPMRLFDVSLIARMQVNPDMGSRYPDNKGWRDRDNTRYW